MGIMTDHFHIKQLRRALALAQPQRGCCAPNPAVGAVVVKGTEALSTGVHLGCGCPHAEVEALKK